MEMWDGQQTKEMAMCYSDDHRVRGGQLAGRECVLYNDDDSETVLPTRNEVCPTCEGEGTHVNPSVDSHGISAEEFAEDPDFADEYFRGMYDVACYECGGKRVVRVVDQEGCTPEEWIAWCAQQRDLADMDAEMAAERRCGA
jgi:hypothetical protein